MGKKFLLSSSPSASSSLSLRSPSIRRGDARRRLPSRVDEDADFLSPSVPFSLSPVSSISLYLPRELNPSSTVLRRLPAFEAFPTIDEYP